MDDDDSQSPISPVTTGYMGRHVGRSRLPIFALIIGINNYINKIDIQNPDRWKLFGAVADADAMKRYLKDDLQVPEDQIITLYNEEASRSAIIKAFQDLRNDKRIRKGDPILIFYAGHGGELPSPDTWGPEIRIQCLVPQDCGATHVKSSEDSLHDRKVAFGHTPTSDHMPIPDRTIGALIELIAKEKGDNITVIFDCCHSASGTRDYDDEYISRSVNLNFEIPDTLDENIWAGRGGNVADEFAYHGLRSHVLLAACRKDELAYERYGRGQFTHALLEVLKKCSLSEVTYDKLLDQIQLYRQHPQCEGFNRHRTLFDGKVSAGRQVYHSVEQHRGGKYVIDAGRAHGVAPGVEITLFDQAKRPLVLVRVLEASSIEDFETTVTISAPLAGVAFGKLTRVGGLPLYVDPHSKALEILQRIEGYGTIAQQFRLVEAGDAKLEVTVENDQIVFKVLDQRLNSFGLTKLPYRATQHNVADVLGSAAHYYWFLGLTNEREPARAKDEVAVNFYRLLVDYDIFGLPIFSVDHHGPTLCQKDSLGNPMIDFVVDPKGLYGIEIKNNTQWDLYLNAFFFNNSDLSIVSYFTQSTAGKPDAPLKRGEAFTMGYGSGGTSPFSYTLDEDQDIDVGYLKIFFATRPIDLSDVAQQSPFPEITAREGPDDEARERGWIKLQGVVLGVLSLAHRPRWFTLTIPVVQRRNAAV